MSDKIKDKRSRLLLEFDEIEKKISDPAVSSVITELTRLNKKRARLLPLVTCVREQEKYIQELKEIQQQITKEKDSKLLEFLTEEQENLEKKIDGLEKEILILLLPKDENTGKNVFLEIRAGTGGEEAALFAKDLLRMYTRFLEEKKIDLEIVSIHASGQNGIKEGIILAKGEEAYDLLHLEGGGHRVQRIPQTESSGRIHTSACTVAVIPEVEESEFEINSSELRIDVYRSSGPGGQSVNTTDSAVRITHFPSGLIASCQDEKSQYKNKAKAMSILRARLRNKEISEKQQEQAAQKKAQIGSGDRSEKIRTYNFPQNRVTDHRINFTSHNLDRIMAGELLDLIKTLLKREREIKLATII